jgi:signal transduction histidine kinase
MIGYLDLLTTEALGPLSHEQKDALDILNTSYYRLQELIDNLLTFSVASQGRMDLQLIPISLENLTKVIVAQSQAKANQAKVDIVTNLPKDLPKIQADQEKITWVILQLVENAIKFNQPGGMVKISAIPENLKVTITITDTGIGIQETKLDEIFESFHQLDGSPSRRYGGTGLGLALAQRIIDAHGSSIDVTSKVGEGTRFTFSLPVDEVQ